MKTIVLLYGGQSEEHEISCRSAAFVYQNIDRSVYGVEAIGVSRGGDFYIQNSATLNEVIQNGDERVMLPIENGTIVNLEDFIRKKNVVVFPMIHGKTGEDGCVQGLCKFLNVPVVSGSVRAMALSMDKVFCKMLAESLNIPTVPYITITSRDWSKDKTKSIDSVYPESFPWFVKPNDSGSAVGCSLVHKQKDLEASVEEALKYSSTVLIERAIVNRRELEVALLGNAKTDVFGNEVGEIISEGHEFYDYKAKYSETSQAQEHIPAVLDDTVKQKILEWAHTFFHAIEMEVYSRVDFFMDTKTGELFFNEINSVPGMTSISLFPKLMKYQKVDSKDLIQRMISLSLEKNDK